MKRLTISLPDELADKVRHAAGGEGHVSAYVARALAAHHEREGLDDILAAWHRETPVADETARQVGTELDGVGLVGPERGNRTAGWPEERANGMTG